MRVSVKEQMVRQALVKRIGRRVARGLTKMRKERADGIRLVLVHEYNAAPEQERFAAVAEVVRGRFEKLGLYTEVQAYETEHMGGQHTEALNHVILTVRKKASNGQPQPLRESDAMILNC